MKKTNYHTHTARCGHAEGTDEEYVLAALSQGFDTLGFSDHVPWPYRSGFSNPRVRMHISRLPEYVESVKALKEKYAGRIDVLAGFECEYFPDYMNWLADMKDEQQLLSCFGAELTFGTGGLRGVLGVGTNRMNQYTVGRATQGLADYMKQTGGKSVAIAYDSRLRSDEFAHIIDTVMVKNDENN
jgi:hypothetical protein